uniref:Major facilitator superfamily (MFS) profile domain-containing protein n=1 Tax=Panagrolaimus sp. JU765 TaxID=591449 RepID=A0AC34Q1X6_9BILA
MQLPAPVLIFAIVVHGFFGSYTEILDSVVTRLATPLGRFYNESMILHYDHQLDQPGLFTVFSFFNNFVMAGSIVSTFFLVPLMDKWGRKIVAVYLRSFIAILACILMLTAKYFLAFEIFGLAVFFIGMGKPLRSGVTKLYVSFDI